MIPEQLQRPVILKKIKITGNPSIHKRRTDERSRPVLSLQSQRLVIKPSHKLMNLTLQIEKRKISFQIPFPTPAHKINSKHICASPGISTDSGLAYRNS